MMGERQTAADKRAVWAIQKISKRKIQQNLQAESQSKIRQNFQAPSQARKAKEQTCKEKTEFDSMMNKEAKSGKQACLETKVEAKGKVRFSGPPARYPTFLGGICPKAKAAPVKATIRDGLMMFSDQGLSNAAPILVDNCEEYALGVALMHYSIGAGVKKFGQRGEDTVTKELRQLHDIEFARPIHGHSLTKEKRGRQSPPSCS
jgi:hypothetical protein